mgnify:CR=1 FL=1
MNLKDIWLEFPIVISYLLWFFDLPGRLLCEYKWNSEMKTLAEMHKEIDSSKGSRVPKDIGWPLERTMETRIYRENWTAAQEHRIEKKYEGISEEVWNKMELVHLPSRIASQDVLSNQAKRGDGRLVILKGNVKRFVKMNLLWRIKRGEKKEWIPYDEIRSC